MARPLMGTTFRITTYSPHPGKAKVAAESAFERVAQLNLIFSDYNTGSEVSQLSKKWTSVSSELWQLITRGQEIAKSTKGAFDLTMGRLTKLWRHSIDRDEIPNQKEIKKALKQSGFKNLETKNEDGEFFVRLKNKIQLDFGGIAKGYAIDEALRIMKESGLPYSMVDGGGDLALGESPPGRKGWLVARANVTDGEISQERIWLSNCAIASSGSASQFIDKENVRYSHIINPITGYGIENPIEVSVIASNGLEADAWATAMSVLGANHPLLARNLFGCTSVRFILESEKTFTQLDRTTTQ